MVFNFSLIILAPNLTIPFVTKIRTLGAYLIFGVEEISIYQFFLQRATFKKLKSTSHHEIHLNIQTDLNPSPFPGASTYCALGKLSMCAVIFGYIPTIPYIDRCHKFPMQYVKYQPKQLLRDFIECYFIWRSEAPKATILVDSPPSAFSAIIFNLAGRHSVRIDPNSLIKLPSAFISGQSIKNYELAIETEIDQVGIVFKPSGLYHLFGLQMFEFTNSRENLNHVLKDSFKDLQEKLYHSPSDLARISLLEEHLLARLNAVNPSLDGVDKAASAIIDNFGNVKIPELISHAFMSRRKFERHLLTRVGLSPKYYARIRRYGYTCLLMAGQRSVQWDQLLYQVGYYDQSHFIKDFKEFSGLSPSQYLLTNNELAHSLNTI